MLKKIGMAHLAHLGAFGIPQFKEPLHVILVTRGRKDVQQDITRSEPWNQNEKKPSTLFISLLHSFAALQETNRNKAKVKHQPRIKSIRKPTHSLVAPAYFTFAQLTT
jgi:hypothetical protein